VNEVDRRRPAVYPSKQGLKEETIERAETMEQSDCRPESNCPIWVRNLSGATLTCIVVIGCGVTWISGIGLALL
jgi:hypothetical protein